MTDLSLQFFQGGLADVIWQRSYMKPKSKFVKLVSFLVLF